MSGALFGGFEFGFLDAADGFQGGFEIGLQGGEGDGVRLAAVKLQGGEEGIAIAVGAELLQVLCNRLEELEGDLVQKFEKGINLFGKHEANKKLVWSAMLIALKGRNTLKQGEALS